MAFSEYGPLDMQKGIAGALEPDARAFFNGEAIAPYNLSTLYSTLVELDIARFDEQSGKKPVGQFADYLGIGNQTRIELLWHKKLEMLWEGGEPLSKETIAELDLLQEEAWREKKREEWRGLFGGEFCDAMYRELDDADSWSWRIADDRFHFRSRSCDEAWTYGYDLAGRRAAWEQKSAVYEEFDTSRFGVTVGVFLDALDRDLASLGYEDEYSIHQHVVLGGDPDQDLGSLGHEGRCGFFRLMVFSEVEERLHGLELLPDVANYESIRGIFNNPGGRYDYARGLSIAESTIRKIVGESYAAAYEVVDKEAQAELKAPVTVGDLVRFTEADKRYYEQRYPRRDATLAV